MNLKKALLGSVAGLLFAASASAQVNHVPQIGDLTWINRAMTYTASGVLMVPAATATDIFCLNGSTSRNVHLRRLIISGTAGTAITTPVLVNLNHSLDTGGTANTGLGLPVPVPLSTNNPTATATLTSYSANPTVNDTTPNLLGVVAQSFAVTTSTGASTQITMGSGGIDLFEQGWDILKAGTVVQQICLNLDGKTVTTGLINVTAEWTED